MNQPTDCILPAIEIASGPWRAEVFDPRPDPFALGARYVHGGYIKTLWFQGRQLTGRAVPHWDPYVGQGIPDVFEWPLGVNVCLPGEEFIRIGAGRLRRQGRGFSAGGLCSTPVEWRIEAMEATMISMRCADEVVGEQGRVAYELQRRIALDESGMTSHTVLTLRVPWNHPVCWFTHPFLAQARGDETGFELPDCSLVSGPAMRDAENAWRLPAKGGLANVTGLWGGNCRDIVCRLAPVTGGGRLRVSVDKPMDHVVLFASESAASPEPQLSRLWKDNETAAWSVRYTVD